MSRGWISTGRSVAASYNTDVVVAVGFFLGAEIELWQLPAHPPSAWLRLGAVVAGAVERRCEPGACAARDGCRSAHGIEIGIAIVSP